MHRAIHWSRYLLFVEIFCISIKNRIKITSLHSLVEEGGDIHGTANERLNWLQLQFSYNCRINLYLFDNFDFFSERLFFAYKFKWNECSIEWNYLTSVKKKRINKHT